MVIFLLLFVRITDWFCFLLGISCPSGHPLIPFSFSVHLFTILTAMLMRIMIIVMIVDDSDCNVSGIDNIGNDKVDVDDTKKRHLRRRTKR